MFYLLLDGERMEDAEESLFQRDFKRMQELAKNFAQSIAFPFIHFHPHT